ncbi:hypothetical protein GCM10027360_26540 [Amycolatopsis echigonensis]
MAVPRVCAEISEKLAILEMGGVAMRPMQGERRFSYAGRPVKDRDRELVLLPREGVHRRQMLDPADKTTRGGWQLSRTRLRLLGCRSLFRDESFEFAVGTECSVARFGKLETCCFRAVLDIVEMAAAVMDALRQGRERKSLRGAQLVKLLREFGSHLIGLLRVRLLYSHHEKTETP